MNPGDSQFDIEKIVQLVTQQLLTMRNQSSAVSVPTTASPIDLSDQQVISAELISRTLAGKSGKVILIKDNAVVTPAAKDLVRDQNLEFKYLSQNVPGHQKTNAKSQFALLSTMPNHSLDSFGSTKQLVHRASNLDGAQLKEVVPAELAAGRRVIALVREPAKVACTLNRNPNVFARTVESTSHCRPEIEAGFNCFLCSCPELVQKLIQKIA